MGQQTNNYIREAEEQGFSGLANLLRKIKRHTVTDRQPDFDKIQKEAYHTNIIKTKKQATLIKVLCQFMYALGVEKSHRLLDQELDNVELDIGEKDEKRRKAD